MGTIKIGEPKNLCNYQTITLLLRVADPDYFGKADSDPNYLADPHSIVELYPDPHPSKKIQNITRLKMEPGTLTMEVLRLKWSRGESVG
jgi:hypothetical protein